MYSSSSTSNRLLSISITAIVAVQIFFIRSVLSQKQTGALNQTNAYLHHICINKQGSYKPGSPYDESLNRVIRTIKTGNFRSGFMQMSHANRVFVKHQCRGDSYFKKCHSCLDTTFAEVRRRCPNAKGRIIWYDNCVLELSPVDTFMKIDYKNTFYMYNAKDVSGGINSFNQNTRDLLYMLKENATSNETNPGHFSTIYAAGEKNIGTTKLYAMVQCTKDLHIEECKVCLNWILSKLPKCCNGKQGGRFLSTSCNFRYEIYPFINV